MMIESVPASLKINWKAPVRERRAVNKKYKMIPYAIKKIVHSIFTNQPIRMRHQMTRNTLIM